MKARRSLALKREALTELTTGELSGIEAAGAAQQQISLPHIVCVVLHLTENTTCIDCER